MITDDEKRLRVLEDFSIDEKLPKYLYELDQLNNNPRGNVLIRTSGGRVFQAANDGTFSIGGMGGITSGSTEKKGFFGRLMDDIKGYGKTKVKQVTPEISIQEFFNGIKKGAKNIKNVEARTTGYEALLKRAEDSGQVALAERLLGNIEIVKYETKLVDAGFDVCISEADVTEFYKKSDRGVALDYVKNFTRVIPCEIIEAKQKLDELKIFDNYVIMHYDPNKEAYQMTEEEIEDKKDPILFGLIRGSDKLYFIGDWIDDICDLTFDELVEVLGEDGIDETKLNVNMYGDVEDVPCSEDNIIEEKK